MAVKLFLDNILLPDVYSFEGFLNRHKNDEKVNNYSIVTILKNSLILLKIVSKIVLDLVTPTD